MLIRTMFLSILASALLGSAFAAGDLTHKTVTFDRSKKGNWDAKFKVAQFQGGSVLARAANAAMLDAAEKRIAKFQKESRELRKDFHEDRDYTYDEAPTVGLAIEGLIVVVTDVGSYTGGAHPYSYPVFDNWGIVDGKPAKLRLQDLLIRGRKDAEAVSRLVMGKLAKIDRADWVQDGSVRELDKVTENSFTITKKGLQYTFAAYVMGCYASGPIDVDLSWSELRGLVNPNGPLKPLFAGKSR